MMKYIKQLKDWVVNLFIDSTPPNDRTSVLEIVRQRPTADNNPDDLIFDFRKYMDLCPFSFNKLVDEFGVDKLNKLFKINKSTGISPTLRVFFAKNGYKILMRVTGITGMSSEGVKSSGRVQCCVSDDNNNILFKQTGGGEVIGYCLIAILKMLDIKLECEELNKNVEYPEELLVIDENHMSWSDWVDLVDEMNYTAVDEAQKEISEKKRI